jgi:hypothetical protein
MITATGIAKGVSTAGATIGILGLSSMAWACAIIGAFFSVYLEDAKDPREVLKTIITIFAWAFAAALLALVVPHIHVIGIGDAAGRISLEARAGILGLSIRWAVTNGKAAIIAKAKGWGEK